MKLSPALVSFETKESKDKTIDLIATFFDTEFILKMARSKNFVKRKSKLGGLLFFALCVYTAKKEGTTSLEDLCRELQKEGVKIRKQSLQGRFNKDAKDFMQAMVEHALEKKLGLDRQKLECKFGRIVIDDSTVFQLPAAYSGTYKGSGGGASIAAIKNQYCYDLLSQEIIDITVQEDTVPDCKYPLQDLRKDDLRIEDLGYFKIDRFRQIQEAGAYYLSRLKFGVNIFVQQEGTYKPLDLLKVIRDMRVGEMISMQIFLGKKEKSSTRMVLERIPMELANQKRRKLKTDKQNKRKNLSKERLILCDVNAFITNCTPEQLPENLLRQCYSLRWQIEIMFKAWKSVFKIDKVKQMKIERFECFHYGCLMLIIASTHLLRYFKQMHVKKHNNEISELKFFKLMASMKQELKDTIKNGRSHMAAFFDLLTPIIERTCIKEQKKNRLIPLKIIENLA